MLLCICESQGQKLTILVVRVIEVGFRIVPSTSTCAEASLAFVVVCNSMGMLKTDAAVTHWLKVPCD